MTTTFCTSGNRGDSSKLLYKEGGMTEASIAVDKLRRIEGLWDKLKAVKTNTPEYKVLIKEIGTLSAEYQKFVEVAERLK